MSRTRDPYNGGMLAARRGSEVCAGVLITLNGEPRQVPADSTVRDLVRRLALDEEAVAIEMNRRILKRPNWRSTLLGSGDRVEIVHFVGGG